MSWFCLKLPKGLLLFVLLILIYIIWFPEYYLTNYGEYTNEYIMSMEGVDGRWQAVQGIKRHKFLVFSAFYDSRDPHNPLIRVIAINPIIDSEEVKCRLYFENETLKNNQFFIDVLATINPVRDAYKGELYQDCHVLCSLKSIQTSYSEDHIPNAVSIIPILTRGPWYGTEKKVNSKLSIKNFKNRDTVTNKVNNTDVGVCVKPIHSYYNNTLELIEFIELNKLLGVKKFTFYNESMSEELGCILNYYAEQENLINVIQWNLLSKIELKEVPIRGVLSALNDCIYRNMNEFHYMMQIDLDEFIIPRMHDTIPEMLQYLDLNKTNSVELSIDQRLLEGRFRRKAARNSRKTGAYSFQNAMFYQRFDDDESLDPLFPLLRVLRKTRRISKFSPVTTFRAKYICVPNQVKTALNHFIDTFWEGSEFNVPTSIGILHHYRHPCDGTEILDKFNHHRVKNRTKDCIDEPSEVDRNVHKFKKKLLESVNVVLTDLSKRCMLNFEKIGVINNILPLSWSD